MINRTFRSIQQLSQLNKLIAKRAAATKKDDHHQAVSHDSHGAEKHDSHGHDTAHDSHGHDAHGHGHEIFIKPGEIGYVKWDWRQDPCLEWGYGGHHGHASYDWRDDPKHNPDLHHNPRNAGWGNRENCQNFSFPSTSDHDPWTFTMFPANYKSTDLSLNLMPQNKPVLPDYAAMPMSYSTFDDDVAHEYDYESEDLDFQCESFKMQHFRKKGGLTQWVILGFLPIIALYLDFIYQHFPDEDYWRIQHPPPLNHPFPDDTDDTDTVRMYNTKDGRYLVDSGRIRDIWYDIVDGKKVYRRFSGVNQPMENL